MNLSKKEQLVALFQKRAKWEEKNLKHHFAVALNPFHWLQAFLAASMVFSWEKVMKKGYSLSFFFLVFLGALSVVNLILVLYQWMKLEKSSRMIIRIDKKIAEELKNKDSYD